jgi:hypothetical protein
MEDHMRWRLLAALAIGGLTLVALGFKGVSLSSHPAGAETAAAGISIFDLHLNHPGMKNLPVHEIPAP